MLPDIVVGGEEWEGARWYGIVAAHDNRSYKLTPVTRRDDNAASYKLECVVC